MRSFFLFLLYLARSAYGIYEITHVVYLLKVGVEAFQDLYLNALLSKALILWFGYSFF